jgi:hypothetical protein
LRLRLAVYYLHSSFLEHENVIGGEAVKPFKM